MSEQAAAPSAPSQPSSQPNQLSSQSQAQAAPDVKVSKSVSEAPKSLTPSAVEYEEVKVNGKMVKMTRQEMRDRASMSFAAQQKFDEAKKDRQYADGVKTNLKTKMMETLMDPALGLSRDEIRKEFENWYHREFIEPESLTEDQRKLKDYESKLKKYEEQEQEKRSKEEQDQQDQLTAKQRDYLHGQIIEAMETSGLPKTKFFASRMAFYMRQNALNGWEAPIDMIVKQVKNERQAIMSDMSEGSSAEQLISMLGDGVINKIRQHDLKQLRERRQNPSPQMSSNRASGMPSNGERLSSSDVTKRLRDIRMGKL